ncbi:uncharacterized protein EV154DRAFT_128384 [Mucor mucedo]|uniref:uncharacterized protein n=1 Tax=Mucor mucedo TaxID=29922 RepID=UPI0022206B28|nr:uncharacterized protein EV154DRAFT_128384 [Mucor mucedo]KAI7869616.1 hypothetical protein EV154DRAFT_128384 [Mucor mucedo]
MSSSGASKDPTRASPTGSTFTHEEGGIPIQLRSKPNPLQKDIMSKIIQGFERCHDILIKSKGSGKFLAVLVASLAWRQSKVENLSMEEGSMPEFNDDDLSWMGKDKAIFKNLLNGGKFDKAFALYNTKKTAYVEKRKTVKRNTWQPVDADSIPKIYIACPTYDRIAELVRELDQNIVYRPTISVIGGRKQKCVLDTFHSLSADEPSQPQSDKKRCGNRDRVAGPEHDLCPYFSSKVPIKNAEVIFCPHPYLFNTVMRKTMGIQLQNSIVIMDDTEAAETAAKDAISIEVGDTELARIREEFELAIKKKRLPQPNAVLLTFLDIIETWMKSLEPEFKQDTSGMAVQRFAGEDMLDKFVEMKLTQYKWDNIFKPAIEEILGHFEFEPVDDGLDTSTHKTKFVSDKSLRTLQSMLVSFDYIFDDDERYTDGFTLALLKKTLPDLKFCLWCTDAKFMLTETANRAHSYVTVKTDQNKEIRVIENNNKVLTNTRRSITPEQEAPPAPVGASSSINASSAQPNVTHKANGVSVNTPTQPVETNEHSTSATPTEQPIKKPSSDNTPPVPATETASPFDTIMTEQPEITTRIEQPEITTRTELPEITTRTELPEITTRTETEDTIMTEQPTTSASSLPPTSPMDTSEDNTTHAPEPATTKTEPPVQPAKKSPEVYDLTDLPDSPELPPQPHPPNYGQFIPGQPPPFNGPPYPPAPPGGVAQYPGQPPYMPQGPYQPMPQFMPAGPYQGPPIQPYPPHHQQQQQQFRPPQGMPYNGPLPPQQYHGPPMGNYNGPPIQPYNGPLPQYQRPPPQPLISNYNGPLPPLPQQALRPPPPTPAQTQAAANIMNPNFQIATPNNFRNIVTRPTTQAPMPSTSTNLPLGSKQAGKLPMRAQPGKVAAQSSKATVQPPKAAVQANKITAQSSKASAQPQPVSTKPNASVASSSKAPVNGASVPRYIKNPFTIQSAPPRTTEKTQASGSSNGSSSSSSASIISSEAYNPATIPPRTLEFNGKATADNIVPKKLRKPTTALLPTAVDTYADFKEAVPIKPEPDASDSDLPPLQNVKTEGELRPVKLERPENEHFRMAGSSCDKPSTSKFVVYRIPRKNLVFDANGVPSLKQVPHHIAQSPFYSPFKNSVLPMAQATPVKPFSGGNELSIGHQMERFRKHAEATEEARRLEKERAKEEKVRLEQDEAEMRLFEKRNEHERMIRCQEQNRNHLASFRAQQEALRQREAEQAAADAEKVKRLALMRQAQERLRLETEARAREDALRKEKARREAVAKEKLLREKAAKEKLAREKAAKEKLAREKAAKEKLAREKAAKKKAAADAARAAAAAKATPAATAASSSSSSNSNGVGPSHSTVPTTTDSYIELLQYYCTCAGDYEREKSKSSTSNYNEILRLHAELVRVHPLLQAHELGKSLAGKYVPSPLPPKPATSTTTAPPHANSTHAELYKYYCETNLTYEKERAKNTNSNQAEVARLYNELMRVLPLLRVHEQAQAQAQAQVQAQPSKGKAKSARPFPVPDIPAAGPSSLPATAPKLASASPARAAPKPAPAAPKPAPAAPKPAPAARTAAPKPAPAAARAPPAAPVRTQPALPRYKSELSIAGQNLSFFSRVKEEKKEDERGSASSSSSSSSRVPKREHDDNVVEFIETASGLVLPKRYKKK